MFAADEVGSLSWLLAAPVGAVLLWAAFAKLGSLSTWREQAVALGAPAWATRLVPFAEALLGGLLVAGLAGAAARLAAIALLGAFTALLAARLAAGQRPPCACFGTRARPISWWSTARNGALVALLVAASLVG
jgi:hypothetical protein